MNPKQQKGGPYGGYHNWNRYYKRIFQLHGVDKKGKTILKRRLMRDQVLMFMDNLPKCLVGIEACGGANYWAREITKL